MGLFSGPRRPPADVPEERSAAYVQALPLPFGDYSDIAVTPSTAQQSVAVRSTVDLIASLASELPVVVSNGSRTVPTPENIKDPGGDGKGREDWVYCAVSSWCLTGNVYGVETSWDRLGRTATVDLVHPDDVSVAVFDGAARWYIRGQLVDRPDMLAHWRVNPAPGRLLGLSPIEQHAASVGISLSATRFGRQWFQDGAHPSGMFRNTVTDLSPAQAAEVKARLLSLQRGTREPLVMGKGWEFSDIQISPEESQFLETAGFSEAQCARIFGPGFAEILGYPTGGSMTYSNIVDRRQDLLVLSLNKWLRRTERVLTSLAPDGWSVSLNREALLEATTLQRYQAHSASLTWKTVNEIRATEGLAPVPWGDAPIAAGTAAPTEAERARYVAELVQKIYLGVGVVLTADEAREIANRAGAGLTGSLPTPPPAPAPAAQ